MDGCPVCGGEDLYKAERGKDRVLATPFFWICKTCGVHIEDRRASGWEESQQAYSQNTTKH